MSNCLKPQQGTVLNVPSIKYRRPFGFFSITSAIVGDIKMEYEKPSSIMALPVSLRSLDSSEFHHGGKLFFAFVIGQETSKAFLRTLLKFSSILSRPAMESSTAGIVLTPLSGLGGGSEIFISMSREFVASTTSASRFCRTVHLHFCVPDSKEEPVPCFLELNGARLGDSQDKARVAIALFQHFVCFRGHFR
ncbi:hypothetical protein FF38_10446 [Lucilia cuprina]|uniref:Uncharacterized protein n=1 Tax=Lucilia cuprina TaxID=7375 RepID=A0A0L0CGH3_LUCCU|nr:hypothetical protein FF38_10446 [Lucilia cuprina]